MTQTIEWKPILISIILTLVAIEIVMQFIYPENPMFSSPGQSTIIQGADGNYYVKANAHGIRSDKEYAAIAGPGVYRYAVVGDSYVFGANVSDSNTLPALMEKNATPVCAKNLEFINFGWPGIGPSKYLESMKFAQKNYNPDAFVVVVYMGNDYLNSYEDAHATLKQIVKKCRTCMFLYTIYAESSKKSQTDTEQHDIATNLYFNAKNNPGLYKNGLLFNDATEQQSVDALSQDIVKLKEYAASQNKPVYFVAVPSPFQVSEQYSPFFSKLGFEMSDLFYTDLRAQKEFAQICAANSLSCTDSTSALRSLPGADSIYFSNDDHLNVSGNLHLAQFILESDLPAPQCSGN